MTRNAAFGLLGPFLVVAGCSAPHDRAVLVEYRDDHKAALLARAGEPPATRPAAVLMIGLAGRDLPNSPTQFTQGWHTPTVCQDLTGECWAFAATSFLESEVLRTTGRQVQLSPSWAVYWEYVAKVRGYARSQGRTEFPRGSELNAALRVWAEHGVVTADDYSGILAGCEIRDDRPLYAELRGLLQSARSARNWDEQALVSNARAILDRHMGPPPEQAMLDGRPLGPHACLHELGIEPGRYVCLMSLMEQPWHTWALLPVPDNWWASRGYYNLPAEEFTRMLRDAAEAGVTVGLCMDTSGPGYCFREGVAVVPSFDIAETGIDDAARQVRFTDGSTTDDHAVHLVGHTRRGDRTWYLIKDSGTKPRNGPHPGYSFYDQDYLSLKCLSAMLPRESVERSLGRPLGPCPE